MPCLIHTQVSVYIHTWSVCLRFNSESTIYPQAITAKKWQEVGPLARKVEVLEEKLQKEGRQSSRARGEAEMQTATQDAQARTSVASYFRPCVIPIPRFLLAHPSHPQHLQLHSVSRPLLVSALTQTTPNSTSNNAPTQRLIPRLTMRPDDVRSHIEYTPRRRPVPRLTIRPDDVQSHV